MLVVAIVPPPTSTVMRMAVAIYVTGISTPGISTSKVHHFSGSRQTGTPDVAVEMDRIYNETDVRGAMPSIAAPVLLLARENDREALEYLATLVRQPQIRLFPGADELKVDEQPAVLDAIREFVGISPAAPELDTVLSTVLFTDVVGLDAAASRARRPTRGRGWCAQHHAVVREALERWRGVESATAGDGFYATFDGPARAIRCAMEVDGARHRPLGIEVRAGVHTGECELMDGESAAASRCRSGRGLRRTPARRRCCNLADGQGPRGGVRVFAFEDAGEHELQGRPREVRGLEELERASRRGLRLDRGPTEQMGPRQHRRDA